METLKILPALEGRRFGQIALGYDRVEQIREEFGSLLSLASVVLDIDREKVTLNDIRALTAKFQEKKVMVVGTDTLPSEVSASPEQVKSLKD